MITTETLNFLKKLKANNDREWFTANKKGFGAANDNVAAFIGSLISAIGKFDDKVAGLDPKSCLFRIYRDVRFSKDKSPYKTNLGAYIAPGGRRSMLPGYYCHIEPGQSFMAGGKHMPDGPELLRIRKAIAENTDEFLKIVKKKSFRDAFGELHGDRLKTAPKGFDPDHKAIDFLKMKGFTVYVEFPDKTVLASDFSRTAAKLAKEMYPFVTFLRKALK